jgi:hypothetical protein
METKIIESMSIKDKLFFNENFYKVSPKRYATNLKHYVETYSIYEVKAIVFAYAQ